MRKIYSLLVLLLFFAISSHSQNYLNCFKNHYDKLTTKIIDNYGTDATLMWLSSWNLATNVYPFNHERSTLIPCRIYLDRSADAPYGSSLYWNLPDVAAAVTLAKCTGNYKFNNSANSYVGDYLKRNTAQNGVILWGNHYYYDVLKDHTLRFVGNEKPQSVDFNTEKGDYHEMRPILPPWELLFNWYPEAIKKHILIVSQNHLVDSISGEFNRHANGKSDYAFLESGGILINSLSWLYSKTNDEKLLKLADKILNYSYTNRNEVTGLVKNSPARERWDQKTSTTEIGLWSNFVIKALQYIPKEKKKEWLLIVENSLKPWLKYGFCKEKGMYYGALDVETGKPIIKTDSYPYKPDTFTSIWNPLIPRHDYPMQFAECCLMLYQITHNEKYRNACDQWITTINNQLPERKKQLIYAENYARVCHYLLSYSNEFKDRNTKKLAVDLMDEAISALYVKEQKMFRSHSGEMRYDAVDGIGLLFFPAIWIQTGISPEVASTFF
jgi:hypothetical protein